MTVQALIQAAGSGTRLGLGPKAFVMLDGRTLLERALALFEGLADGILVAVPASGVDRARALVGRDGVTIIAGGASRSETTRRLVSCSTAPWLLLHDVVHPFATAELIGRLLDAARIHGASAPGVANAEFLYDRAGMPLHAPGEVLVGQKPVAFSRSVVEAGYAAAAARDASGDPSLMEVLALAGVRTTFVESSARNLKITTPADLAIAEALMALDRARTACAAR
jgi:2-C-methyl-D-erythritol 4-phosphate cytidylyltransferase